MDNGFIVERSGLHPDAPQPLIERLEGWEDTKHLATMDMGADGMTVLWHVPNATVAAGVIITTDLYGDLHWGNYRVIPNGPVASWRA